MQKEKTARAGNNRKTGKPSAKTIGSKSGLSNSNKSTAANGRGSSGMANGSSNGKANGNGSASHSNPAANSRTSKPAAFKQPQTTKSAGKTSSKGIQESQLMKLFENELKDIYWAEKALTKAIPKMIKKATSEELISALENHLEETVEQVARLEQVFQVLGKPAKAKKCEAMAGLMKEAEEIMADCDKGAMRDAGIISAAQKVEHYEIASYGTLRQFAETLGLNKAVELLEETLDEEKAADEKLTEVAVSSINMEANEGDDEEEEDKEEDFDTEDDDEDESEEEESEPTSKKPASKKNKGTFF